MAYIVGDPCVNCKYTDCVAVCPVDCFFEGENMLVIHPDECIDCGACEPECPTTAIFEEADLPEEMQAYVSINAVFSGAESVENADTAQWPDALKQAATTWPNITAQKDPLPGADDAAKADDKLIQLSPKPA